MRLIDADVYAAEMRKKQDNCRVWKNSLDEGTELYARAEQCFVTFVEAALTLKNQPTIPAIPIEWLEAQNNSTEYFKTVQGQAVELILELWQKEQEAEK